MNSSICLEGISISRRLSCSMKALDAGARICSVLERQALDASLMPTTAQVQRCTSISNPHSTVTIAERKVTTSYSRAETLRGLVTQDCELAGDFNSQVSALHLSSNDCSVHCHCQCHLFSTAQSPNFLSAIVGNLFAAYHTPSWLRQSCNGTKCNFKAKQATFAYTLPSWLVQRIVYCSVSIIQSRGPEIVLKMMRLRRSITMNSLLFPWDYRRIQDAQDTILAAV